MLAYRRGQNLHQSKSSQLRLKLTSQKKPFKVKDKVPSSCSRFLPASLAHLRIEVTSLPFVVLHWDRTAAALTPTVPSLALTPQRKAVAVPALSATCALVLYVCTRRRKS